MGKTNTGIPGMSFSWKRACGLSRARQQFARQTGIPTTRSGVERKLGAMIVSLIVGLLGGGRRRRR